MKRHLCFCMLIFMLGPFIGKGQLFVRLYNPTNMPRKAELVSIEGNQLEATAWGIGSDTAKFVITDTATHQEVIYQIERIGHNNGWRLLLQANLGPKQERVLRVDVGNGIGKEHAAESEALVFCRYVPERADDFAWENNRIAFRMYGKALENDIGNAKGIDVWTKRTHKMILNEWYKKDDYHVDHGEGLDYYDVGFTLGAGDNAPFFEDSVWFPGNYTNYRILDNGPLRCTFELTYDPWQVGNQKVSAVKLISLDAGSQLSRIRSTYTFKNTKKLDVVIGLVKRDLPGNIYFDEVSGVMSYWQPNDAINGTTGVGAIISEPVKMVHSDKHQYDQLLGLVRIENGATLEYFSGAAWDKAGQILSAEDWTGYLKGFSARLNAPVQVQIYKED